MSAAQLSTDPASSSSSAIVAAAPAGRFPRLRNLGGSRALRVAGWGLVFLVCLVAFTAVKFPETRVKALVLGQINAALAPRGITLVPESSRIQFGLGVSFLMEEVQVSFPPPAPSITLDRIRIRPSLLPLLFSKVSARVEVKEGEGSLDLRLALPKNPGAGGTSPVAFDFEATELNLASLGVGAFLGNVPLFGVLAGEGTFAGDLNAPESWQGQAEFTLSRLRMDPQQIAGFQIPALAISELDAKLEIDPEKKKVLIERFRLGKPGGSDDLTVTLSGDVGLSGRNALSLPLSVTARFSLSDRLRKDLVLLDAILGPGKQSDGSYAYKLGGTLGAPFPTPIPASGAPAAGTGSGP